MDGRFLTAFITPKKWEIAGYELKPFSLRHMMSLSALESPFVGGDKAPSTPEQVLAFLRVCSSQDPSSAFTNVTLMDRFRCARMEVDTRYFVRIVME